MLSSPTCGAAWRQVAIRAGRTAAVKSAVALDRVIEHKNACRHARATTAPQNRRVPAIRTSNAKSVGFQHLLNHRHDRLVGCQAAKRKPLKRRNFGLNREADRSLQTIQLLLKLRQLLVAALSEATRPPVRQRCGFRIRRKRQTARRWDAKT
jgi:hypothetical protein